MRIRCGIITGVLALSAVNLAAAPRADIPFTAKPPVADGRIDAGEWAGAASVRQIRPLGSAEAAPADTEFLLMHDGVNLYVACRSLENDPAYPEAYPRPWHDLLFRNDDAVQVVLGVADPDIAVRGKVNVGGYEGALDNDFTAADFYYLYTVNSVNARQRQFNEAPLEEAMFDSAVTAEPGREWIAEMVIPFAGCGLGDPTGRTVYANLFRFRPPAMYGWHLPSFGGYSPMPLGEFTFLPAGGLATREEFPERRPAAAVKPQCQIDLQYGPLNGSVVGTVRLTGDYPELTGVLEVTGFEPVRQTLEFAVSLDRDRNPLPERRAFVIRDFEPGSQPERQAKFTVLDPSGRVVAETGMTCPAAVAPEWLGTDAGIDYVDEKIPSPWTQPAIENDAVRLLDKTIGFAANALPDRVLRDGARHALIAAVPSIVVEKDGSELEFSVAPVQLRPDGTQVRAAASQSAPDGTGLEARARVDFDGFIEYKFELSAADLDRVNRVAVVIPLAGGVAKYIQPGASVQQAGGLTGAGYRGPASSLWVGNEEEGLAFGYDVDPFLSRDVRHQLEIRQDAAGDALVINLADAAGQLQGDKAVFRFFLQPTPTKPYPSRPVRDWVIWDWEGWSRWHGYPDLSKIPAVAERVAELAKQGLSLTLYCCQGLQEDAPEMEQFRSDLELLPPWRYYVWQGRNCFATCKRGPEGDLQLHNYRRIIAETGIRGLMSDGLTVPWGDANPLHREGCGRPLKVEIDADTPSLMVKQREFLKRIRGLFDAAGEEFCLVAHTGGGIDVHTLSLFDAYFEGEQLMRFRRGYYPSEAMFAVGYSGMPWGWRTIYWPKQLHNYDGLDTALGYAMLFNSEYYTNPNTEKENVDVELLTRFSGEGSEFHPFWREHSRIGFQSDECAASLYYNPGESLVAIGNLRYTANGYTLDLRELYPGRAIEVTDFLRGTPVEGPVISDTLAPHSCRLLVVKPAAEAAAAAAPALAERQGFDASEWRITSSAGSVDAVGFSLAATPGTPEAKAEFVGFEFGRDAGIVLDISGDSRLAVSLGGMRFIHDNGWLFYGENGEDAAGVTDRYAPFEPGKEYRLTIDIADGAASVWLGNRLLVWKKPLDLTPGGNRLSVSTWHDNRLSVRPSYLANASGVAARSAEAFSVDRFEPGQWSFVNAAAGGIEDGRLVLTASPERGAATAEFSETFGKDFSAEMMIKLPFRFAFTLGNAKLTYGGGWPGWGWMVEGSADPYGRGWIFMEVPLAGEEYKPLQINLHDGVLDIWYDGRRVVRNLALDLPEAGNAFAVTTWHDDTIEIESIRLSTQSGDYAAPAAHPITGAGR